MTTAKQGRLCIGLLVAIAASALSFALEAAGEQGRSGTGTAADEPLELANPQPRPIPEGVPLARPKSLEQIGLAAEAASAMP